MDLNTFLYWNHFLIWNSFWRQTIQLFPQPTREHSFRFTRRCIESSSASAHSLGFVVHWSRFPVSHHRHLSRHLWRRGCGTSAAAQNHQHSVALRHVGRVGVDQLLHPRSVSDFVACSIVFDRLLLRSRHFHLCQLLPPFARIVPGDLGNNCRRDRRLSRHFSHFHSGNIPATVAAIPR